MNTRFSESIVEDAALAWLDALGYAVLHGPDIAAGETGAGKTDVSSLGECGCAGHHSSHQVHQVSMEHE